VGADDVIQIISQETRIPRRWSFRHDPPLQGHGGGSGPAGGGQREAISAVARNLRLNKGPLKERFERPDGVLLFLGPTGVGKTELAKSLADFLFGDERKMVRLDMSEYRDSAISVDKPSACPGDRGLGAGGNSHQPGPGQPLYGGPPG